ncbi:hypothetical protein OJF2_09320 [Aquisphaera giovannonii]|uniref:Adhesin domain-containing protein n=1 Tax=Aquisphaera giovannonii TaxID=406548 RepID=A0A5B9VX73_9BACT|nr:hypothetical protein [Aquisphaera giovannonii]QEH32461.1 hypothetical protein OJF2_09320 [Aquisphaera giovannonii]
MRRHDALALALLGMACALACGPSARADDAAKPRPRAPGDAQIIGSDRAGAYFVSRGLKERYDRLLGQLEALRRDIAGARISAAEGRGRVDELSKELEGLRGEIERSRVYVAGADIYEGKATAAFPMAADDLLLIDAPNVEIRGWDKPEARCIVEKSVLSRDGKGIDEDLAGIRLERRAASGKEVFGFYIGLADKPQFKVEWEGFPFKEFLGREFVHVRLAGLRGDEGNGQITVEAKNEQGAGQVSGQWRRQARLIVYVPRCRAVGVRGGLAGFRAKGVHAALRIAGEGDRDYDTSYEISQLDGPLTVDNMAIGRVEGVRGDVSVSATGFAENVSTTHDGRGITSEVPPMRELSYRDIDGGLRVRLVRGDLTVGRVSGRIDVENDFGRTTWLATSPLGKHDHRIVSQAGEVEVRLDPHALGDLPLACYSECGPVQLAEGAMKGQGGGVHFQSFTAAAGEDPRRAWHGLAAGRAAFAGINSMSAIDRVSAALHGRPREPGVDVLNRGGPIRLLPPGP